VAVLGNDSQIIFGDFFDVGLPPGITVHLSEVWAADFEFVVTDRLKSKCRLDSPLQHRLSLVGPVAWFFELDLPVFFSDAETNKVTLSLQLQTGVGF